MLKPIQATCLKDERGVRHGFFTRAGGRSDGIYADLNCGFGSNDSFEIVRDNRRRVARHLYAMTDEVVTVYQIHSGEVVTLSEPPDRDALPKADAIVTTTPGLVIGVLTADCTPVLFADPKARVIAAAHAGWRGAVGGVLEATVKAMEQAGAERQAMLVGIGPCITQAHYEVGEEFRDDLIARDPANSSYFLRPAKDDKPHFDLPGYVAARLAVLDLGRISGPTPCTYANESLFFSFRRSQHRSEPDYGRQISAIVLD